MQHPDLGYVQALMNSFIAEDEFEGWQVSDCTHDFYSKSYLVSFANSAGAKIALKFPNELIESVQSGQDPFKRRRLKSLLKGKLMSDADA